jgi:hypothetical protein
MEKLVTVNVFKEYKTQSDIVYLIFYIKTNHFTRASVIR